MARIDSALKKMDLKQLEAALAKRRKVELKKVNGLLARRKKLQDQIAELDQLISVAAGDGLVGRRPNARRLNKITLGEALVKVMASRSKPVHYKELTELVGKRGFYKSESKNLLSTVAVTLKRDKRFKKVKPGVYELLSK